MSDGNAFDMSSPHSPSIHICPKCNHIYWRWYNCPLDNPPTGVATGLARFRADPAKVRVAVREESGLYRASVSPRDDSQSEVVIWSTRPEYAADRALQCAERTGMDGIDLGMGLEYRHPQRTRP